MWYGDWEVRTCPPFLDLLLDLVASPAFPDSADDLLTRLKKAVIVPPEPPFATIETLALPADTDRERNFGHATSEALTLVIRTYQQTSAPSVRVRRLDVIDRLVEGDASGFDDALKAYDR